MLRSYFRNGYHFSRRIIFRSSHSWFSSHISSNKMEALTSRLLTITHGFKLFEKEAKEIIRSNSLRDAKNIGLELLLSEFYQVRCCGVFILGLMAAKDRSVLPLLKAQARLDGSWQVQEIIAKGFDQFCKDNGYELSLAEIRDWLGDANPNVCRAVTEGLRIWTNRDYFKNQPQIAIDLISANKANKSEYLRMSVGNSLRDIGKRYPDLIENEIIKWDLTHKEVAFTYQYVLKRH